LLEGEMLLVNCNGGLTPMLGTTILETVESDDLDWDVRHDDEIATCFRWPEGKHYCHCSNENRIFVPENHVDKMPAGLRPVWLTHRPRYGTGKMVS
jgi:hypothetical protein